MAEVPTNMRVFAVIDGEVQETRHFRPVDLYEPQDVIFSCFFHDEDERAALLGALRELATITPNSAPDPAEIERDMEDSRLRGDATPLMLATVRWWTTVRREGYHAYKLRFGVDRYRCSAAIAFRERTPEELREAVMPAVEELEEAKERVAGFFEYPFD